MSGDPTAYPLAEKIALLAGVDTWHTPASAGVPSIRMSDGPAGVRGTSWSGPRSASFPCGTALGATFDPDLVQAVGEQLGREARAKSAHVLLAPTVNLHRTPIGGRNFECMSEDPVLTAMIAEAYVTGVQSIGVACCIKHFVGNDTEEGRHRLAVWLSADEGRTWPWRRALEDGPPGSGSHGYPSVLQSRDGSLHVSYSWHTRDADREAKTIRHAHFNPEWIGAGGEGR